MPLLTLLTLKPEKSGTEENNLKGLSRFKAVESLRLRYFSVIVPCTSKDCSVRSAFQNKYQKYLYKGKLAAFISLLTLRKMLSSKSHELVIACYC